NVGVRSLMSAFHLSRASNYRLFKPSGGVHRFIREQRLRAIRRELVGGDEQCSRIAHRWGFDDTQHFYRTFKSYFGCTPTDARQAAAGKHPLIPLADQKVHPLARRFYGWLDPAE
ncbi:MAG: helix-turn-helix transcriptional regulator, partial [Phycisphaerae bacterium]